MALTEIPPTPGPVVPADPARGSAGHGSSALASRWQRVVQRTSSRSDALVLGIIAVVVAFAGSWIPSIWYDEAATIASSTRSWGSLARMVEQVDAVHAVFYVIMHAWFDLVGYSPVMLRLPSAIFAGGAVALTVLLAARFGSRRFALTAGLLLIVIPRLTWAGSEGRSYALTMLLATAMTLALVLALDLRQGRALGAGGDIRGPRSTRRAALLWGVYGALAILGIALFLYLALVVLAHVITVLVLLAARRLLWRTVGAFVLTGAMVLVASLPLVLAVVGQAGQLSWVDPIDERTLKGVFLTQFFPKNAAFASAAWVLAASGAVALLVMPRLRAAAAVLLPWLVVPTLAIVLVSVVVTPVYSPRYLTFCVPALALVLAAVVELVPNRVPARASTLAGARSVAAVVLVVGLAALATPSYLAQREPESKQDASWSQAADRVASLDRAALASPSGLPPAVVFGSIAYHPGATARVVEYAYPAAFEGLQDVALTTPLEDSDALWEKSDAITTDTLAGHDTVVLVTSGRDWEENESRLISAGFRQSDGWRYTNLAVAVFERAPTD